MFKKQMEEMIKACSEEVLQSSNKTIKKAVERIKKDLPEDYEDFLSGMIRNVISESILLDIPDELSDEIFEEFIENSSKNVKQLRMACVFDVALEGHEKALHRKIQIPYISSLAELAYAILAAFEAEGTHLFQVTHHKTVYRCDIDYDEEDCYASFMNLEELNLKEGDKLSMCYDFGDDYTFKIKFVGFELCRNINEALKSMVLSGEGFGIWEDAHYEMDLYYENPKKLDAFLKEQNLAKEAYPINEVFDLDELNENFEEECSRLKMLYEDLMEDDEDMETEMMEYLS